MLWLIWDMGLLLLLAFAFGIGVGWQIWSGDARNAEAEQALADNARLRNENETLARRLGEAEARRDSLAVASAGKTGAAAEPEAETRVVKPAPKPEPAKAEAPAKTGSSGKPSRAKSAPTKGKSDAPAKTGHADKLPAGRDDLTTIKGLGPKAAAALQDGGVTRFSDIASWSEADVADWDARINGRGRIVRDKWVEQARTLAKDR